MVKPYLVIIPVEIALAVIFYYYSLLYSGSYYMLYMYYMYVSSLSLYRIPLKPYQLKSFSLKYYFSLVDFLGFTKTVLLE